MSSVGTNGLGLNATDILMKSENLERQTVAMTAELRQAEEDKRQTLSIETDHSPALNFMLILTSLFTLLSKCFTEDAAFSNHVFLRLLHLIGTLS